MNRAVRFARVAPTVLAVVAVALAGYGLPADSAKPKARPPAGGAAGATGAAATPARAEGLRMLLPLGRTAYQTNEDIHLAVVRSAARDLPAGDLSLCLKGDSGGIVDFMLPIPAVAAGGDKKDALATEHVYLNARLLRPDRYTVEVRADGQTATAEIDLLSHVRKSSYRLLVWGRAKGAQQLVEGADGMGFNLFYGVYAEDPEGNLIRAGCDFIRCCTMGGAHQMDLRQECDWSDPYVSRGGAVRATRQALADRTRGNTLGVHFYDEPGLTHLRDPITGQSTPHAVPSQARSYRSAFGHDPISYRDVDPKNPDHAARWRHWARWKLSFMDAAWKLAQFGVSYIRPDLLSVTQSQYGFGAYSDGYYFNVVRSLPVTSGHGGYHDFGLMLLNPSYFLEVARARDLGKPCWYLPCWYDSTTSEQFRLEQYMAFQMGIQGLQTPPDIDPFEPSRKPAAEGVVETNKLAARLGTIFTAMPPTRPPVAMLYSLGNMIHAQTLDRTINYLHEHKHGRAMPFVYLAGKMIQQPISVIVEEDILDGTLQAEHKAVILAGIDHLDPAVVKALETFTSAGGLVMLTGDSQVKIKGAVELGVTPRLPEQELVDKLRKEGRQKEAAPHETLGKHFLAARPLAEAIKAQLQKAKIDPVFACDNPGISATRHAAGDVEYLFAVNAATDWDGPDLNPLACAATIGLADDGRAVYDAVLGRQAADFRKSAGRLEGQFRFGPGQMRVFARTGRPIGGVKVAAPILRRDYTSAADPLGVEFSAAVLAADGGIIGGSIPLRIRLCGPADPLTPEQPGPARYDLYRATQSGTVRLSLPLAANDRPGRWTVEVTELLSGTQGRSTFTLPVVGRLYAAAGRKERAIHFGNDRDSIFRFFRMHRAVTIVEGASAWNGPAAERLAGILKPWDVRCTIVSAADVNKPRAIGPDGVATWVGLTPGRLSPDKAPGIAQAGFALEGPTILLGNDRDNPLIAFLLKERFLPYKPVEGELPGRGRGLIAWQRDGVGHELESITLIAHDDAGIQEAVGTMYEAMAGIEPLMPLALPEACRVEPPVAGRVEPPVAGRIEPPGKAEGPPAPKVAWQVALPDRAVGMRAAGDKLIVLTRDESISEIDAKGLAGPPKALSPAEYKAKAEELAQKPAEAAKAAAEFAAKNPLPGRIAKRLAAREGLTAVGYWGGLVRILDAQGTVKAQRQFDHDITALAWLGPTLAVGLSDGQVVGLMLR